MKQDHEAIRQLAIQIGVRPAARKLGLNEDTVCSWAKRENWFSLPNGKLGHPAAIQPQAMKARPGDVILSELERDVKGSRSKLARLTHDSITEASPVKLKTAQDLKHVAATIQTLGPNWDAKDQPVANLMVNIALLGVKPEEVTVDTATPRLRSASDDQS